MVGVQKKYLKTWPVYCSSRLLVVDISFVFNPLQYFLIWHSYPPSNLLHNQISALSNLRTSSLPVSIHMIHISTLQISLTYSLLQSCIERFHFSSLQELNAAFANANHELISVVQYPLLIKILLRILKLLDLFHIFIFPCLKCKNFGSRYLKCAQEVARTTTVHRLP